MSEISDPTLGAAPVRVPLTEVVYGARFVAPEFSVIHFGEYFEHIRERFPRHSMMQPIARPQIAFGAAANFEIPTLPRVWYEHETRLIQLQIDRFVYNWRKLPGMNQKYPGFTVLFAEFQQEWTAFIKFCGESFKIPLQIEELNLSYINHIPNEKSLDVPMFSFREHGWKQALPEPEMWLSQFRFGFEEENQKLTVVARPAMKLDNQETVTSFELNVESINPPQADDVEAVFKWFDSAHRRVHFAFEMLVREQWREAWGFSK